MRLLGVKSSLAVFRWDLIYLVAQLSTDERAEVVALANPVRAGLETLDGARAAYEEAEAGAIVASALLARRDRGRDKVLIEMGGVARASEQAVYKQLFPRLNPSGITRLGINAETDEVQRLLGEMNTLDAQHPLRLEYETTLRDAQRALETAKTRDDNAELTLTLERSNLQRLKVNTDKLRLETHGKLVSILVDKAEADSYFRPTQSSPGTTKDSPGEDKGG